MCNLFIQFYGKHCHDMRLVFSNSLLVDLWQVWEIKKLNIVRIDKPILTINDD